LLIRNQIHRTWVIWSRNILVALLPIFLWIGMMGAPAFPFVLF
jgi:hypothetical protein